MTFERIATLVLCGTLVASSACSEAESEAADTSSLSRSLLAEPLDDGSSTIIAADPALADDGGPRVPVSMVGFNRGSEEAPVKVVEMSDYGCGYCRQFHEESFPTLMDQFIESGMVEWKFVPYVTGMFEHSLVATEAAECTYVQNTEAFETLNRRLWLEQAAWKRSNNAEAVVHDWVAQLGIDMGAFQACVEQDEQLPRIAASTTLAGQLGVRGTPTFIVLGYPPLQGALPLETFQEILTLVYNENVQIMQQKDGAGTGDPGDSEPGDTGS
jgi:protein-disulfide isomerase